MLPNIYVAYHKNKSYFQPDLARMAADRFLAFQRLLWKYHSIDLAFFFPIPKFFGKTSP
jgi:hypothetical protein